MVVLNAWGNLRHATLDLTIVLLVSRDNLDAGRMSAVVRHAGDDLHGGFPIGYQETDACKERHTEHDRQNDWSEAHEGLLHSRGSARLPFKTAMWTFHNRSFG